MDCHKYRENIEKDDGRVFTDILREPRVGTFFTVDVFVLLGSMFLIDSLLVLILTCINQSAALFSVFRCLLELA